jgi:hypothetical protein
VRTRLLSYGLVVVLAAMVCSGLCGVGGWLYVNGFTECSTLRPYGITEAQLYGTYRAYDGGTVTLYPDHTEEMSGVPSDTRGGLPKRHGGGHWDLLDPPPENDADILMDGPDTLFYVGVGGSRRHPWLYFGPDSHDRCGLYRLTRV